MDEQDGITLNSVEAELCDLQNVAVDGILFSITREPQKGVRPETSTGTIVAAREIPEIPARHILDADQGERNRERPSLARGASDLSAIQTPSIDVSTCDA